MRQGCGTSDHSLFVCRLTLQALVFFLGSFPLSRRFPPLMEAMRGTCIGVWRLDSALARLQPPSPARQCPGDAKGVTGLLFPERRRGGVGFGRRPPILWASV
jgi:hypothetical protein